ncbi:MAG: NUDIX domain-containing protein [Halodesulfurarchaeum sp.]
MDVHDEFIPDADFASFIDRMPEVCVEVVLRVEKTVLLARRTNEPAKGEWFWPGSRLYKGEGLEVAAKRVAREELGIEVDAVSRLGVNSHFWDRSPLPGSPSRHTVNVVFVAEPRTGSPRIELNDEHDDYRFVSEPRPDLHEYVRRYFEEYDIP